MAEHKAETGVEPAILPQDTFDRAATYILSLRVDEILDLALDVGVALLSCGAEVHRVEDTVSRICAAYGAQEIEVFAITSVVIAQIRMPDGNYSSQTRRITRTYHHLARLEKLNALSREICRKPLDKETVNQKLEDIHRHRPVPEWLCFIGGMLATSAFTLFFGGTWRDGLVAAIIGFFLTLIERHGKPVINAMAATFINSLLAGLLAILSVRIGLGQHEDLIIIGTIMLEIPGISFGNALRDMLFGDTLAGVLRFIQAILQSLVMAAGYLCAMLFLGQALGV